MEPTSLLVGLYFLVSLFNLSTSKLNNIGGWNSFPGTQYHIQTDEGEERYFKYQTKSGQYRKEKRLEDGTVVGTYGWVDPNGYLRLRDYIADNQGYRIIKTKMIYVGDNSIDSEPTPEIFHTKYSSSGLPSITFQAPQNPSHRFSSYISPTPNTYISSTKKIYLPQRPSYKEKSYDNNVVTTASENLLPSKISYSQLYPNHPPSVEFSPNVFSGSSISGYVASTSPNIAILEDVTVKPISNYAASPKSFNYVTTPSPILFSPSTSSYNGLSSSSITVSSTTNPIPAIGVISNTTPSPPPLPISGKFFVPITGNNNFITETEKNKLFFQYEDKLNNYYKKRYIDTRNDYHEYDGIATVQNGFHYYLPRHYHEEATSQNGQERSGSFGYIDPFGIRRVIYYNTSPSRGFIHRKNNRYVGFDATPYDPRPAL